MGPGKMLEECCDLIQSFDAKVMTVDAHAMEQLGDTDAEDAAPHKVFMQQVLYETYRALQAARAEAAAGLPAQEAELSAGGSADV